MSAWSEPAPAKINLSLHVVGQQNNGYHLLEGLSVFTQLSDGLTIREAQKDRLHIIGPFAKKLDNENDNIILRAVALFRVHWPNAIPEGLDITLEKHLPVAAGIGGGSADAAAALRIAARMSKRKVSVSELADVALQLGADVPMCLFSRTCLVAGVGEEVQIVEPFPSLHLVLANPGIAVSTADIFGKLKSKNNPKMAVLPTDPNDIDALGLWLQDTRNDLEAPAIESAPEISMLSDTLSEQSGCLLARMSGSGATVFGVFSEEGSAMAAAQQMRKAYPNAWVAHSPII